MPHIDLKHISFCWLKTITQTECDRVWHIRTEENESRSWFFDREVKYPFQRESTGLMETFIDGHIYIHLQFAQPNFPSTHVHKICDKLLCYTYWKLNKPAICINTLLYPKWGNHENNHERTLPSEYSISS